MPWPRVSAFSCSYGFGRPLTGWTLACVYALVPHRAIAAITIAEMPRVVRLVRSLVLTLREQPYVEAAIASSSTTPNEHAANVLDARDRCVFRTDVVDADAECRDAHATVRDDLVHYAPCERDRNGEAVTGVVTGWARDRAVDSDYFTARVDERAAGIAWVERGVGLNDVVDQPP